MRKRTCGRVEGGLYARGLIVTLPIGPGEAEALGFIYGAFDDIRKAARGRPKLHIFLSCPNGIGVLLEHLWNRVPATQLYDDANSPEGYFPTFLLAS